LFLDRDDLSEVQASEGAVDRSGQQVGGGGLLVGDELEDEGFDLRTGTVEPLVRLEI